MTRCAMCDWSPNGLQSDYFLGTASYGHKRHLTVDNLTKDTICSVCALNIALDLALTKPSSERPKP